MSRNRTASRRDFLQGAGQAVATSALAAVALPQVHAGESNTIQVALVGCGGRGTGAAENALSVKDGPIKLVAMADVFEDRLDHSHDRLSDRFGRLMDVPEERRFIGFDAYKHAIDCLKPGDVAIFTTPPAFRWVHFGYAIEKGVNVFMEKPVTVDGPSTRKLLKLAEQSEKQNLKVGVGLMCRHCASRKELHERIKQGQIGDLITLRAYRLSGTGGVTGPKPADLSELMFQIRKFHSFLWASGGAFMDFLIHNIDECCWMKDAWPVRAQGYGGRQSRDRFVDQNFDHYSVEYTFGDGTKLFVGARNAPGCHNEFASYAHGTKGSAIISTQSHTPAYSRIYKGQNFPTGRARRRTTDPNQVWMCPQPEPDPYQLEWNDLIAAIRQDKPYNEAKRGAEASLVTAMGRMAVHTGQVITFEDMLNHPQELAPEVDRFTADSPAPVHAGADGKYPIARPGVTTRREF
ncbi:MAG TPA: Gfo/Idh/MocA family oxidoreductase [Gemmataceae bacterium]|nr:Gfo/Idh/MocA family oxidoreductase [Gemmataceae bacterium]